MTRLKKTQNPLRRLTLRQLRMLTPSRGRKQTKQGGKIKWVSTDGPKETARGCAIRRSEYALGSKEGFKRSRYKYPTYYNEFRSYVFCGTQRRYSYIRFFGPPDPNTAVWVWCNCQYFKYNLEYVLAMRNSSTMKSDSGPGWEVGKGGRHIPRKRVKKKPPSVRNPGKSTHLCKHLWLASQPALKQTQDLVAEMFAAESEEEESDRRSASLIEVPKRLVHLPYEDF